MKTNLVVLMLVASMIGRTRGPNSHIALKPQPVLLAPWNCQDCRTHPPAKNRRSFDAPPDPALALGISANTAICGALGPWPTPRSAVRYGRLRGPARARALALKSAGFRWCATPRAGADSALHESSSRGYGCSRCHENAEFLRHFAGEICLGV